MAIAVDTSGSITNEDLKQFAYEISEIMREFDTRIHVIYCDSQAANVQVFTREDLPLEFCPRGGGGTDFRPAFEWIEHNGIRPACMVYLTDLCCRLYPDAPEYHLLWVQIEHYRIKDPPFGVIIKLEGCMN